MTGAEDSTRTTQERETKRIRVGLINRDRSKYIIALVLIIGTLSWAAVYWEYGGQYDLVDWAFFILTYVMAVGGSIIFTKIVEGDVNPREAAIMRANNDE